MTGKELIIYILSNNLEDEPVFKDGSFVGFITVREAAVKMGVGVATIYALIAQNKLDYIVMCGCYLIPANCELILGGTDA